MEQMPDFRPYLDQWSEDLKILRQNNLLDESAFINFAKNCGIEVWGVVKGDPGDFHKRGWLLSDGESYSGGPLFHPFRIYPLHQILTSSQLNIAPSATLHKDKVPGLVDKVMAGLPSIEQIEESAFDRNQVINLAILLEPIYWPRIVSSVSRLGGINEDEFEECQKNYQNKLLELVRTLDPDFWRQIHEYLRFDAARMDQNDQLYLLLRVGSWNERKKLKGPISGSLWLRHIAEVIRRAFEEAFDVRWIEEDYTFGMWPVGARTRQYGSERPLDDAGKAIPYLAQIYGLHRGSVLRWYVEGETEYYAILEVIDDPAKAGIEIVNLHGVIQADRDNIALKLGAWLKQDKDLRRFSMISFDLDVPTNAKTIRRQIEQENIVGYIAAHDPDFEFANYTLQELVKIAAHMDEKDGLSGDSVRQADWTNVKGGGEFEAIYKKVSERKMGLKGEGWGRALAAFALDHPHRPDDGTERPFWQEIRAALMGRIVQHDFQMDRYGFDQKTFKLQEIKKSDDALGGDSEKKV